MINHELSKRIISSLILIPLMTYAVLFDPFFFKLILIILFLIALIEWFKLINNNLLKILGLLFITFSFYSAFIIFDNMYGEFFYSILIICIATDIGGYVFGKAIKGPKLTKISPNKTYSGVIGSFLLPIIIFYLINSSKNLYVSNFQFNLELILFISLISQIGDLIISYFKRIYKIKDTGNIIPGHGGLLDRIDGMLFVFPSVYLILSARILFF